MIQKAQEDKAQAEAVTASVSAGHCTLVPDCRILHLYSAFVSLFAWMVMDGTAMIGTLAAFLPNTTAAATTGA